MKTKNLLLRTFGITFLFIGAGLNLKMHMYQEWPTGLFVFVCVIGILEVIMSSALMPMKVFWQIFWMLVPFILIWIQA